ncbi:MAG: site-specific integrase [Actinomycetota bacterium]|nr:site-specific integrase [Actinomycetota bacterium]
MSASLAAARLLVEAVPLPDSEVGRVQGLLDCNVLALLGWDATARVLRPPVTLGQVAGTLCLVEDCTNMTNASIALCTGCQRAFNKSGADLSLFVKSGVQRERFRGQRLCLVCRTAGHERPAHSHDLCVACDSQCQRRGQSSAAFAAGDSRFPPAPPRPTLGRCVVATCGLWAGVDTPRLCDGHRLRWAHAGKPPIEHFAATTGPILGEQRGAVVLVGLSDLVVAELLFGVQSIINDGQRLRVEDLRSLAQLIRDCGAESVRAFDKTSLRTHHRRFVERIADRLAASTLTVEGQRGNDTLDLRAWGKKGYLTFVGAPAPTNRIGSGTLPITQRWLRDATEAWVFDLLPRLRSDDAARVTIKVAGIWSSRLSGRPDRGEDPSALGRADVTGLLEHLGMLTRTGKLSEYRRCRMVERFGTFLRGARGLGLTGPGRCLAGLPDEVALRAGDVPARAIQDREDEVGEAIPDAVVAQILASFDGTTPEAEARLRLALGTGRRPSELCRLPLLDCLDYDTVIDQATGEQHRAPVLVHDMPKANTTRCRLPLSEGDAQIIRDQQARVRARYPGTDEAQLPLFPRTQSNFRGTEPYDAPGWAREVRLWARRLELFEGVLVGDELVVSRDVHGNAIRYLSSRIHCYGFRHSYAQRHIDRGTEVAVLCALLGHRKLDTTQGYYRIKAAAKRQATDRMLPLQIAVSGPLRLVADVSDSDRLRHGVGRIAVPMGWCEEVSNVKAEGKACPMRHRCFGCVHYRTDPSFLLDLRSYLARMLADRERLAAAIPELAEWARKDAMPSDDEIEVVRRLIADCEARLVGLNPAEHTEVLEAMEVLANSRAALEEAFPLSERGQVSQSVPVAFPRAAAGR